MKNKKNVFSDNRYEINILVYTESFLQENEAIEFLKKSDEITGINIYFMPLISDEIELSFETGKYSYCKEGVITSVIMNFKDCGSVVSMHRGVPNDIEEIEIYRLAENSIINGQLVSDLFDYVVVKEKLANKDSCNIPVISLEECRDILRLFLVQRKQFQISEHTSTDETGYYIYKHKQLFSEFQNYWSAVCKSKAMEGIDYDIQIMDSPHEVQHIILERNQTSNNRARILAGYCWNWNKVGENDSSVHDIQIGDFGISWNLKNTNTYAIDEGSVNEAGCIHTSQGLEFDYVGIIIGADMRYEDGQIVTDFTKRAKTDYSLRGIKTMYKNEPEKALAVADEIIKNTYRTLMTRGMKGCYVYCVDESLAEYLKECLKIKKERVMINEEGNYRAGIKI